MPTTPEPNDKQVCDSCFTEDVKVTLYTEELAPIKNMWLCDVCASTEIGRIVRYESKHTNVREYRVMAQVTNFLLKFIR